MYLISLWYITLHCIYQVITIERNELLHLVAYYKDKDVEREKEKEKERCANGTNSLRTPTANGISSPSAYETSGDYTFESVHTEQKHNKNSDNNGIYEAEGAIDGEKKNMTRTFDREFQDNSYVNSSKSNYII